MDKVKVLPVDPVPPVDDGAGGNGARVTQENALSGRSPGQRGRAQPAPWPSHLPGRTRPQKPSPSVHSPLSLQR